TDPRSSGVVGHGVKSGVHVDIVRRAERVQMSGIDAKRRLGELDLKARIIGLTLKRGGDDSFLTRRQPDMVKGSPPEAQQRSRQDERQRGQKRRVAQYLTLEAGGVIILLCIRIAHNE